MDCFPDESHSYIRTCPNCQIQHVPLDLDHHKDDEGEVVEVRVLEGVYVVMGLDGCYLEVDGQDLLNEGAEE